MRKRTTLGLVGLLVCCLAPTVSSAPADEQLTVRTLSARLAANPAGAEAEKLAMAIREWIGKDKLAAGADPKIDGLEVAWAIEAPKAKDVQVLTDGTSVFPLVQVGETAVYAATLPLPDGTGLRWFYQVDGKKGKGGQLEVYNDSPDCAPKSDVPKGKLTQQPKWKSNIFDGTTRDWWDDQGFHSPFHGRAILPDSLRWLWRDYKPEKN